MNPSVTSSAEFGLGGPWLAEYTLEAVGAGVVLFDSAAQLIQWNPTAARLIGWPEEQFVGRRLTDERFALLDGDEVELGLGECPAGRVLRTGDAVSDVVVGLVRADGSRAWLAITALPLFGPDGLVRGALGSIRDVTMQQLLQRDVLSAAVQTRLSFEHSLEGQVIFGRDGRLIDWNARLLAMVGRSDTDMMSAPIGLICDIDLDWVWSAFDAAGGEPVEGLTWLVRADGGELPVFGHFWLADRPPHGPVVIAQFLDPTPFQAFDLGTAEPGRIGREAFSHAALPMLTVTTEGVVVEGNLAAARYLGRNPSDLVQEPIAALFDGLPAATFASEVRTALRTALPVEPAVDVRPRGAGGPPARVQLSAMTHDVQLPLVLVQIVTRSAAPDGDDAPIRLGVAR